MTKQHEEFIRGAISRIISALAERPAVKGECTLLVAGKLEEEPAAEDAIKEEISRRLASGTVGTTAISKLIAKRFNISKNEAYNLVLELKAKK